MAVVRCSAMASKSGFASPSMTSPARALPKSCVADEGPDLMDQTSYFEGVAMIYFKRMVLPAAVIGCLIVYEFTRERAAVYNIPVAQVHGILRSAGLPDYVLGSEPKKFGVDPRDPGK